MQLIKRIKKFNSEMTFLEDFVTIGLRKRAMKEDNVIFFIIQCINHKPKNAVRKRGGLLTRSYKGMCLNEVIGVLFQ